MELFRTVLWLFIYFYNYLDLGIILYIMYSGLNCRIAQPLQKCSNFQPHLPLQLDTDPKANL